MPFPCCQFLDLWGTPGARQHGPAHKIRHARWHGPQPQCTAGYKRPDHRQFGLVGRPLREGKSQKHDLKHGARLDPRNWAEATAILGDSASVFLRGPMACFRGSNTTDLGACSKQVVALVEKPCKLPRAAPGLAEVLLSHRPSEKLVLSRYNEQQPGSSVSSSLANRSLI